MTEVLAVSGALSYTWAIPTPVLLGHWRIIKPNNLLHSLASLIL